MNERIQELEIETDAWCDANFPANWTDRVDEFLPLWNKKFAELIVRECLLCCERTISDPVPKSVDTFEQGGIHCMDEIKQHFGIGMSMEDKKTLIKELLGVKND